MSFIAFPRTGEMLPHFTLEAEDGRTVRISNYRGKNNLVVIFAAALDLSLISDLQRRATELVEENALVLIVNRSKRQAFATQPLFVLLHDPGAVVARRFGAEFQPGVYITDQYGEIYSAHRASEGTALPDAEEVLASLRHINAACPE